MDKYDVKAALVNELSNALKIQSGLIQIIQDMFHIHYQNDGVLLLMDHLYNEIDNIQETGYLSHTESYTQMMAEYNKARDAAIKKPKA